MIIFATEYSSTRKT